MKNLADLAVFIKVMECKGFSSAARALGLAPATVSKQIARLEAALGIRLFERNTRRLRITEEGQAIAKRVRPALSLLDEAAEIARQGANAMTGCIRVTAPVPFGVRYVAPLLGNFRRRYTQLEIDLRLTDDIVDVYEDDVDLAIRIGVLPDSRLVSRCLAKSQRILVAAPSYLDQFGVPKCIDDLKKHQCIELVGAGLSSSCWVLSSTSNSELQDVAMEGTLRSDNGAVLREWSVMGLGIALRETWDVADELREGTLVRVLPEWAEPAKDIQAVRAYRDPVPCRIKRLVDEFREQWKNPPWGIN